MDTWRQSFLDKLMSHINNVEEKTALEIGVYQGVSSIIFSSKFKKVYAVDPWKSGYDSSDQSSKDDLEACFLNFKNECSQFYNNIEILRKTSEEASHLFEDESLDFVYIDGNHQYDSVVQDIKLWLPKIKKDGYIGGHDYCYDGNWYGVTRAVNELLGYPEFRFGDGSWLTSVKRVFRSMKIKIISVPEEWTPETCVRDSYPQHNKYMYGVEQDFHLYLKNHKELLTDSSEDADFFYLPIYWERVAYNWGFNPPHAETVKYIKSLNIDLKKVILVCSGDLVMGDIFYNYSEDKTKLEEDDFIVFNLSNTGRNSYVLPQLAIRHNEDLYKNKVYEKKYLANFVGRSSSAKIRSEMCEKLKNMPNVFIVPTATEYEFSEQRFIDKILESYLTLCPRGSGINSFRFWESMQLGVCPIYLGDHDCFSFADELDWNILGFKCKTVDELIELLKDLENKKDILTRMGRYAKYTYDTFLDLQKWELIAIKKLYDILKLRNEL